MICSKIARKIQPQEYFEGQCSRWWSVQNRNADRNLRVVYLYVHDGQVCVDNNYANADNEFDAGSRFAVLASSL